MSIFRRSKKQSLRKGVVLGITGGLVGSWLMDQSQSIMEKAVKAMGGESADSQQGEPAPVLLTLGAGSLYGAAVWLLADEVTVPALGLSKPPKESNLAKHLEGLGAHLIYGLTTEGVRWAGSKLAS